MLLHFIRNNAKKKGKKVQEWRRLSLHLKMGGVKLGTSGDKNKTITEESTVSRDGGRFLTI